MEDVLRMNTDYTNDPDVQLLLAFKSGDKSSFEKLMVRFYPRVLNFIYRFVNQKEVAEDLTQDVFMKVYKSAVNYQPKAKVSTWIFTIAKNTALNELSRRKKFAYSLDADNKTSEGSVQSQHEDFTERKPDQQLERQERMEVVRTAVQSLPENQRMAVILRRYENMTYDEIAKTMGTTSKAVKSLLSRAKENLKINLMNVLKS